MSVPEGISCKLRRANKQLESLDKCVKRFLEADPQPYRILPEDDPDTRERIYWLEIVVPPPLIWSVIAGEIIHDLRTALDHLAYALCLAHAPGKDPPRSTEFPIFWDEDRFDNVKPGGGYFKIRGMSWEMQSAIRDFQPHQRGDAAKTQPLWVLQDMSNIDKHRHLNLAVMGMPTAAFYVDPSVEFIPTYRWSEGRLEVGRMRPLMPEAEVQNDPSFIPQVILDERADRSWRPFIGQIRSLNLVVGDIAEKLSARFLAG